MAPIFTKSAPNISRSPLWDMLNATLLAPRIERWFLDFWKIFAPLIYSLFYEAVSISNYTGNVKL